MNTLFNWFATWLVVHSRPKALLKFDGVLYFWSGYYGCQLCSVEHKREDAGVTRLLHFGIGKPSVKVTIFRTVRRGFVVYNYWSIDYKDSIEEHRVGIENFREQLRALV